MNDKPDNMPDPEEDVFDPGFADDDIDVEVMDDFPGDDWDEDFDDAVDVDSEDAAKPAKTKSTILSGKRLYAVIGVFIIVAIAGLLLNGDPDNTDGSQPSMPGNEPGIQVSELAETDLPPQPAPINPGEETPATAEQSSPEVALIQADPTLEVEKIPAVPPQKKLTKVDMSPVEEAAAPSDEGVLALTEYADATKPLAVPPPPTPADTTAQLADMAAQKEAEFTAQLAASEKEWAAKLAEAKKDLAQKLNAAHEKLKAAEGKANTSAGAVQNLKDENSALKKQITALESEKEKAVAENKTLAEAAKKAAAAPPSIPKAVIEDKPEWVLRSAAAGRALVSQKGTDIMKSVKAGDTLPGIGRILSIKLVGPDWVIEGTEGKIER